MQRFGSLLLKDTPDDEQLHVAHGLALAYLGRRDEAIREGRRSVELLPLSRDGYSAPYIQHQFVRICMILGERDKAVDLLEPLLKVPYYLTPAQLVIDPNFAPLKGHPRFEALLYKSIQAPRPPEAELFFRAMSTQDSVGGAPTAAAWIAGKIWFGALSIERLEGSRWRMRRTLRVMGIESFYFAK